MSLTEELWGLTPIITVQELTKELSKMSRFCTLITLKQEDRSNIRVEESGEVINLPLFIQTQSPNNEINTGVHLAVFSFKSVDFFAHIDFSYITAPRGVQSLPLTEPIVSDSTFTSSH